MKNEKVLYLAPRVLSVLFIIFLALFALDVFEPGKTIGYYIVAFLIHLVPNFILVLILLIAWRHERLGGAIFVLISILFAVYSKTYLSVSSFMLVSLPAFLIGIMFIIHDYLYKKKRGEKS